ncbi:similar to Saccharomyces cerevisiae YOR100C CRC1 Mitochondrial inner membrane carnitine transporter [Maudiozyma saulgeensis]|uniref:Similar to Saccharomyces cerevisiae YOR100C CRC1 Mitochondrial inner membrane carnitine transporter n=1 Tax=Maudiozyma saulgeensis TaxID=1789683 RepID=A0A1X7R119_9SACH|nr:similar to Saccharomyces cerevisiae YOR100C CRC1 Mitochondrial inner membrane carnitine transporter [Kazachstania saulgeensis]
MSDTSLTETTLLHEETDTLKTPVAPPNALKENFKSLIAGGVGGVCAVLTGHPFDLIKVRCQNGQAKGTMDAISIILKEARNIKKGPMAINYIKSFYKGVIPPLLGVTPIFAVSFWGYDLGKKIVSKTGTSDIPVNTSLTITQMATAGFISAIPTTLVTAPTERVKVVLQTSKGGSFVSAAKSIVREGGISSLFKGSLATLARDGPGSALYFASYEVTKNYLNNRNSNSAIDDGQVSIGNVCLAGGIAGMSMWLVVFPIDTIKTTLQASNNGKSQSMVSATREIYLKRGGIKGFFPGLGPALIRSFPANAATFLGVEMTHSLFKKYNVLN